MEWKGLILGLVAATANVCGGLAIVRRPWHPLYLRSFIALGSGFMLAAAVLEMLPESFDLIGHSAATWMLGGYLLIHFLEHTMSAHFHFGEETHAEEVRASHRSHTVLLGLAIHAFMDGVSIASGFLISDFLGWIVFLAVFLHKMPEGFALSSVMLASGKSPRTALLSAAMLGLATLVGVAAMMPLRAQVAYTLPLSAGVTFYVAASDLIPLVNQEPGVRMALGVFVGVLMFFLLKLAFPI